MLLYWKYIYTDELYDALYDPCDPAVCAVNRYTNFTSTYVVTHADKFANYSVGLFFVFGFLVSTLLNPLVFYHFWNERSMVIVDMLFRILAICDFITNVYSPLFYASEMFRPGVEANVKRSWPYMIAQSISCNVGCISQSATTLLAVARYIRIRSPFLNINKTLFLGLFMVYAGVMTAITITGKYMLYTANRENKGRYTTIMNELKDVCFYLNIVQCFIGILFSILCVATLFKTRPTSGEELAEKTYQMRKKGCVTILLINLPYLISLAVASAAAITQHKHLRELMFTFLPIFTSSFNPLILSWRNTSIRKRLGRCYSWVWRKVYIVVYKEEYIPQYNAQETMMSTVLLQTRKNSTPSPINEE